MAKTLLEVAELVQSWAELGRKAQNGLTGQKKGTEGPLWLKEPRRPNLAQRAQNSPKWLYRL